MDLADRLELAAKIHDDLAGKGGAMAATIREAASALRSSGEAVGFVDGSRLHTLKEGRLNLALWGERGSNADTPLYLHPATPASAWRPIAEAPRDGTPVLAHGAAWVGAPVIAEYDEMYDSWFVYGYGDGINPQPTHFQPLPTPPTRTKGG